MFYCYILYDICLENRILSVSNNLQGPRVCYNNVNYIPGGIANHPRLIENTSDTKLFLENSRLIRAIDKNNILRPSRCKQGY